MLADTCFCFEIQIPSFDIFKLHLIIEHPFRIIHKKKQLWTSNFKHPLYPWATSPKPSADLWMA